MSMTERAVFTAYALITVAVWVAYPKVLLVMLAASVVVALVAAVGARGRE